MRLTIPCYYALLLLALFFSVGVSAQRSVQLFDAGWLFHRGPLSGTGSDSLSNGAARSSLSDGAAQGLLSDGAARGSLSDKDWKPVDLPHDWSIEDMPGTKSPFSPDAINGVSEGFTTAGTGWYRKSFPVALSQKGKCTYIRFDGVYMNADVWVNGIHLGNHPYGYTSFRYDITDVLHYGSDNWVTVRVRSEGATSRWYPGAGIYRHVWMETLPAVHIAPWGTYITTPEVSGTSATVRVRTTIRNERRVARMVISRIRLLDTADRVVAVKDSGWVIGAGVSVEILQELRIAHPALWSGRTPSLYKAVTEIIEGDTSYLAEGKAVLRTPKGEITLHNADRIVNTFGIRTVSFDAVHGFLLNGVSIKLKGGCFHDDHGPLGSKSYDRAEERRVQLLLASGYNAIRCSHNAPAFLDACDRLGLLVIDEAFDCWEEGKNPDDYHLYFDAWWQKDMESMIRRDRNHPSIILWSIGNEIPHMDSPKVAATAKMLSGYAHDLDPTRGVIAAVNSVTDQKAPFMAALDVAGYNYSKDQYESDHQAHPERIMLATESYPLQAYDYWKAVEDHPYVVGDFVWTAWDYIGEASIGWRGYPQEKNFYPWNLAFCGDIDICGWKRPASYYRDALWHNGENISIFITPPAPSFEPNPKRADWSIWNWFDVLPDWNWAGQEGKPLQVVVYSTCQEAELFLDGKSLGRQMVGHHSSTWTVPYQSGTLKAIGYREGKIVRTAFLRTAGAPVQIRLSADRGRIRAGGEDLSYVTVQVLDAHGVRDPKAVNRMQFFVEGPGTIAGVGNADPMSTESYQLPERSCWQGRCMVILRSGARAGILKLKVSSKGLPDKEISINVE